MARTLESLALITLIGVVLLRPMVAETYDSSPNVISAALDELRDPSPVRTLVFDVIALAAVCCLCTIRALRPPEPYRPTGLEWGYAIVVVAAVVSCLFAGNKRLAINATIDWLCLPLIAMTLARVLRTLAVRRLVLAVILAGAAVQAVQCIDQFFSFDDTWNRYMSIKEEFWGRQGVDLDSNKVEMFEHRIRAREASGSFPHANIAASYLLLCGFPLFGLALAKWRARATNRNPGRALAVTILALIVMAALILTNSFGARIAAVMSVALWLINARYRSWIRANRNKAFRIGWLCVAIAAVATIGYGLSQDGLPGWSLTFRWQYWKTSAAMIADHGLTGVGRENFGRHYLRYKPIQYPEEVSNPHDLFVQAAAEWGWLGLIGLLVMLYSTSSVLVRTPGLIGDGEPSVRGPPGSAGRVPAVLWGGITLAVVTIVRIPLLGADDPNYVYYATVTAGMVYLSAFAVLAWALQDPPERGKVEVLTHRAVLFGLFAFLVHDTINFALFVPGSAVTFFALLGISLSFKHAPEVMANPPRSVARWLPVTALYGMLIVVITVGLVPVARSQHALHQAQASARKISSGPLHSQPAYEFFQQAMAADSLDPTPARRYAEWLLRLTGRPGSADEAWQAAEKAIQQTIRRDPQNVAHYRTLRRFYHLRATVHHDTQDHQRAIESARKVLALYPQSPSDLAALANCQLETARATRQADTGLGESGRINELVKNAIRHYDAALSLDDHRLQWEELNRFSKPELQKIRARIEEAKNLLAELRTSVKP